MSTLIKKRESENETKKLNIEEWYDENKKINEDFCDKIKNLLKEIIDDEGIVVADITGRVKEKQSLLKKFETKTYEKFEQLTDFVGVRVIGYVLDDVDKICKSIEEQFDIDEKDSGDKGKALKDNEVGYRSVHYIANLGRSRCELTEYKRFKGMKFEIQVRTLLQHAWAEIEHDNGYKFSGVLPSEIKRRFYLVSGALELLDREFQSLANELKVYAKETKREIKIKNLDIEINSTSLHEYLSNKLKDYDNIEKTFNGLDSQVIRHLKNLDINTIQELDSRITPKLLERFRERTGDYASFMMDLDLDKYFKLIEVESGYNIL